MGTHEPCAVVHDALKIQNSVSLTQTSESIGGLLIGGQEPF